MHLNLEFWSDTTVPQQEYYKDINFQLEYQEDFIFQNDSESDKETG